MLIEAIKPENVAHFPERIVRHFLTRVRESSTHDFSVSPLRICKVKCDWFIRVDVMEIVLAARVRRRYFRRNQRQPEIRLRSQAKALQWYGHGIWAHCFFNLCISCVTYIIVVNDLHGRSHFWSVICWLLKSKSNYIVNSFKQIIFLVAVKGGYWWELCYVHLEAQIIVNDYLHARSQFWSVICWLLKSKSNYIVNSFKQTTKSQALSAVQKWVELYYAQFNDGHAASVHHL